MKPLEPLFLVLLVVFALTEAAAEQGDKCAADLQPCVKLWRERDLCAKLGGPICQAVENDNATEQVNKINGEKCSNSNIYCPATRKCMASNSTCDINSNVPKSGGIPWDGNCTSGEEFCPISMSCVSQNVSCSIKDLYDWVKAGNTSGGPYGSGSCAQEETFCLASMSCSAKNASCSVAHNATAMQSFCPKDSTYCNKRASCIQGNNSSCSDFPSFNSTGRADPGNAWKEMCEIREHVCTRFSDAMAKCWPKIASCVNSGNASSSSSSKSSCSQSEVYCNSTKKCQPKNDTCCAIGEKHCASQNKCIPDSHQCCPSNQTYCASQKKCLLSNEKCCPAGQYHCKSGHCIPFERPCKYQEKQAGSCPADAEKCKIVVEKSAKFCLGRTEVCSKIASSSIADVISKSNSISSMMCNQSQTYCPLSNGCKDKNADCTLDCTTSFLGNLSETPWGSACGSNETFCDQTMTCESSNFTCTARTILDWADSVNKSGAVFGIPCAPGQYFCSGSMSCSNNASCGYTPKNVEQGVSPSGAFVFNALCKSDEHFCVHKLNCQQKNNTACSPLGALNYTGRSDNGTGWLNACKISKFRCDRLKYAVDMCYNKVKGCYDKMVEKVDCYGQGKAYCKLNDRCQNASIHCCPLNETYCPDRKMCIKDGSPCKLEACTETTCGQAIQMAKRCEVLEEICPLVTSAPKTIVAAINKMNNRTKIPTCKADEKYCPLFDQCSKDPCKLNLDEVEWYDQIPWTKQNCTGGKSFCFSSMSCIRKDQFTCSVRSLMNWRAKGNMSVSPFGTACSSSQKFCLNTFTCIDKSANCSFAPPAAFNGTANQTVFDFMCGPYHRFCGSTFRCVRKSEPCVAPKALNFTGVTFDNNTGYLEMCKAKDVFCPRFTFGMMMCGSKKEYAHCIKKTLERCASGEVYCEKSKKCLKPSQYCLGPGECPPYQFDCPELGGCINKTRKCEVPKSKIIYKSAWFFQKLEEAKPAIFTSGNTIAIVSVSESNGKVEYNDGSKWTAVSGITEKTALVLQKSNMLRFVPNDAMWHGVVLFNYTIMSGTPGQKVDASSSKRDADQTIVSMILPSIFVPNVTEIGAKCQIWEDEKGKGFKIEDKIRMNYRNFSTDNNVPVSLLPSITSETYFAYREYLKILKTAKAAVAITYLQNKTETGGFKGNQPSRDIPTIVIDMKKMLVLSPATHYNGPINASFSAGVLFDPNNNMVDLDMPPVARSVIFAYMFENNATSNQHAVFRGMVEQLKTSKTRPTKPNVLDAFTKAEAAASGQNKTDLAKVKTWVSFAYDRVKLVLGADEALSKHSVVTVNLKSGRKMFVYGNEDVKIVCDVRRVNDAPVLTSYVAYFPPIAFNLTAKPNNGFQIKEITERIPYPYDKTPPKFSNIPKLITDVEGDVPGIGIAFAKNSSVGAYYYRNNSKSSWQIVDLKNTLVNGKLVNTTDVLLLEPTAELKFQMHDQNYLWTNVEAREKCNLLFVAWDQSDKLKTGIHKFTFPVGLNSSLSKKFASAFTQRYGCDGKTGSRGKIDVCGRCGGDGVWCKGCDNVANSGAVIDHCGNCTGGTTNLTFNFRKDCGGGCGTSFNDSCGVCQKYGKVRNFTDCSGKCFGGAIINKCNKCVLGSTGKPKTDGEDVCGICGGNGKSCLDCAGTAKGTKKIDLCGKCLEPTDRAYDAQCVKLGGMNVISGPSTGGEKITVSGAGLKARSYKAAKCEFFNSGKTIVLDNAALSGNKFEITTKAATTAGLYSLRCSFDSDAQKYQTSNNFTFYNKAGITLSSITPNETEANKGAFNVTITGSGFVDTGFLKCLTDKKKAFPATFISSTQVRCAIPNQVKSAAVKIAPQFGQQDTTLIAGGLALSIFVYSPYPTDAKFTNNLQAIALTMNKPAKHSGKDCTGIFSSANLTAFGSRAKCILRTPTKMFIALRGKPTLSPGHVLLFQQGSLDAKFEAVTKKKTGTASLTVTGPAKKVVPKARLSGPSKVGTCGKVVLDASRSSGGGGRRLTFKYRVRWASTQKIGDVKADGTADLANMTAQLNALPAFSPRIKFNKNNLKLGYQYEFLVEVKNFLNEVSENASIIVVRENKQLPVVDAGPAERLVKASRDFTLQARPVLSPCLDPNSVASSVVFSWEIDAVGIDIGVTDKPRLSIKKGLLTGGKTYTLTVTAAMASDQTLSSTKSISIKVESSPLEATIRGGTYQVVGASSTLKLDSSPSKDPDGSSESAWYQWVCTDSKGDPCFVPDPKNALRKIRLVLPTTALVTIDVSKNLETNSLYTFTMTFNKGNRKATTSKQIKVEAGDPPAITIKPQKESKENPTTVTMIKAVAKSTMASTNVTWECVQEDGYAFIDLSVAENVLTKVKFTFTKAPGKATASRSFALVIPANALSEGVNYKFRLTVAHKDSTAYAETVITTNAAPTIGTFTVSPINGTAMTTLFALSAPEGWSDDADDFPLQYQFGYIADGKTSTLNLFGEGTVVEEVKLPPGDSAKGRNLTLWVRCKDALGAISYKETTITVFPAVVDSAFLSGASDDIAKSFEGGDWDKALGNVGSLMKSIPADPNNAAVTQLKEKFSDSTLNILQTGGVTDDPSAKMSMYGTMGSITAGGSKMSKEAKKKIKDTIVGIETGSAAKRRRRAVSSPTVTAITVSQAETTLGILSNVIDPTLYDADTMSLKTSFLPVVDSSGQKLCAGLAVGMAAAIAKDKLVVLRSEKNDFANVDTQMIDMACNNCPDKLANNAKVKLGTTLKTSYQSWKCTSGDDLCSGACIISSQQVFDLLSTSANTNTTLTSVVDMKLYNPETYAAISVSALANPVTYHLPVLNVTITNETYFECKRWSGSAWTSTGCKTNHNLIGTANTTRYVECSCTELGYTAAFKATRPPPVVTTPAPTTKAATPTPSSVKVRKIRFALVADYDTVLATPAKKEQFKKDVTKSLASSLSVNESRIVNMTLTKGSIIVQFSLLPDASDSEATMLSKVSQLETMVKSGNYTVKLSDGTVLKADPTSFEFTTDVFPTTAAPVAPTESGLTETEIIIIACVCGGLALIILVVTVICCYNRSKARSGKISPENSRAQLQDDVEMRERDKGDGNYNQAIET